MSHTSPTSGSSAAIGDDAPIDIAVERVAKVYAQAIIEAADRKNCRRDVLDELTALVRDVLPKVPQAAQMLASPKAALEHKAALIDRMTAGRMQPTTAHSLHVLARHGRLDILADVVAAARRRADELEGRKPATFTTAVPLDAADQARLVAEVERAVSTKLAATFVVDPAVIGGLVVRIADTVYDQSVATSLVRLGQRLKQRSIHEIQYGRDRLSSA
ncbi:MAG: synthase subunit delta [Planctomycetota bacterium]|jgi:F-type H+-transporting ATPase subunit delta